MADISAIAEQLGKLTVIEVAELVKKLEADWGVSAAAPVAVAAAAPAVEAPPPPPPKRRPNSTSSSSRSRRQEDRRHQGRPRNQDRAWPRRGQEARRRGSQSRARGRQQGRSEAARRSSRKLAPKSKSSKFAVTRAGSRAAPPLLSGSKLHISARPRPIADPGGWTRRAQNKQSGKPAPAGLLLFCSPPGNLRPAACSSL
jgi:hypothetical protein